MSAPTPRSKTDEKENPKPLLNYNEVISPTPSFQDAIKSSFKLKQHLKDKTYLFYAPTMKNVAEEMYNKSPHTIILGDINWNVFEDGFPDLKVHKAYNCRWCNVAFLADLTTPRAIFEQYAIMCALPRFLAQSVKIFIGYFPTGTMERSEEYGRIATAKTLSRLLSSIPIGQHGPSQICICDLHALQNLFYFGDNVLVRLESCIGLIKQELLKFDDISIAFPDDGASKRFGRFFKKWPQIICVKIRDGNKRIVKIKEGDAKNRNVVIIDDLVKTGGTLAECGKVLVKDGCKSVNCYCTHAVFPQESWKRFVDGGKNEKLFDTFWITDTIPRITDILKDKKPYKVLKTAEVFLSVLLDDDAVIDIEH